VTSNSWLDVGYGNELQEFLLKYVPIAAIYDNQAKRTFEHADINTIIALFRAPKINGARKSIQGLILEQRLWPALSNTARFVLFKVPFEEAINSKNLVDIENAIEIKTTADYRVYPVVQEDLLEDGWGYPEDYDSDKLGMFKQGKYLGNKWGGKYLRAPEIFFTILQKGKAKFVRMAKVAEVRRGFTTGANEFFYFDQSRAKERQIEKRFLVPIIKSPREVDSIQVDPKKLRYMIFVCNKSKSELKGTHALDYIKWGEKAETTIRRGALKGQRIHGFQNIESLKVRERWWSVGGLRPKYITNSTFNDRFRIILNPEGFLIDKVMYGITPYENDKNWEFGIYLNSSVHALFLNVLGQMGLGEGALFHTVDDLKKFPVIIPKTNTTPLLKLAKRPIHSVYEESGIDPSQPIREQRPNPPPDRAQLDKIIFDELGLTEDERKEVYWSLCELVRNRLEKAESLKGKRNE
jgi:hypothetical protein